MTAQQLIDRLKEVPPDAEVIVRLGFLEPKHLRTIGSVQKSTWHGESSEGHDRVELVTVNDQEPPF